MDSDELRKIAGGITEWARRVRELRTEEGYLILTHNDRDDRKPGQHLLLDPSPQPAFERAISRETRAFVLDRNGFACQMCGAVAGEPHPDDPTRRARLHIGHTIDKSPGGTDDPDNLRAIGSLCNEGASNIAPQRPLANKLLAQIRRAPSVDRLAVRKRLVSKFPKRASAISNPENRKG